MKVVSMRRLDLLFRYTWESPATAVGCSSRSLLWLLALDIVGSAVSLTWAVVSCHTWWPSSLFRSVCGD